MKPVAVEGRAARSPGVGLVDCPRCAARLTFGRSHVPLIDSCGFESYSLKCEQCGAALVGIIDPSDDRLLISLAER